MTTPTIPSSKTDSGETTLSFFYKGGGNISSTIPQHFHCTLNPLYSRSPTSSPFPTLFIVGRTATGRPVGCAPEPANRSKDRPACARGEEARQRLDLPFTYLGHRRERYSVPENNGRGGGLFCRRGGGREKKEKITHTFCSLRHCLLAINHLKYSDPHPPGALVIVILSLRTELGSETLQVISDGDSRPVKLRSTALKHGR